MFNGSKTKKKAIGILQNICLWYIYIKLKRITKKEKEKKEKNKKRDIKVQPRFELPTWWLQGECHNHYTTETRQYRLGQMVVCHDVKVFLWTRFGQISWMIFIY